MYEWKLLLNRKIEGGNMKDYVPIYNEEGHSNEEVVPPVARRVAELTPSYIQQAHADLILKIVSVIWHWDVVKLLHLGVELINREEREAGE